MSPFAQASIVVTAGFATIGWAVLRLIEWAEARVTEIIWLMERDNRD